MTSERLQRPPIGLVEVVRGAHPSYALIALLLLCLSFASIGFAPGVVTFTWLALVTPSLVVIDLRQRRLPNVLVVPGLAAVLVDGCWAAVSSPGLLLPAAATTSIIGVVMLVLHLVGGLGMGDVKLSVVMAGCLSLVSPLLAVVAAHPEIVALGYVVGQHDPRVLPDAAEHGEEHVALERLSLVDDHERVVQ